MNGCLHYLFLLTFVATVQISSGCRQHRWAHGYPQANTTHWGPGSSYLSPWKGNILTAGSHGYGEQRLAHEYPQSNTSHREPVSNYSSSWIGNRWTTDVYEEKEHRETSAYPRTNRPHWPHNYNYGTTDVYEEKEHRETSAYPRTNRPHWPHNKNYGTTDLYQYNGHRETHAYPDPNATHLGPVSNSSSPWKVNRTDTGEFPKHDSFGDISQSIRELKNVVVSHLNQSKLETQLQEIIQYLDGIRKENSKSNFLQIQLNHQLEYLLHTMHRSVDHKIEPFHQNKQTLSDDQLRKIIELYTELRNTFLQINPDWLKMCLTQLKSPGAISNKSNPLKLKPQKMQEMLHELRYYILKYNPSLADGSFDQIYDLMMENL